MSGEAERELFERLAKKIDPQLTGSIFLAWKLFEVDPIKQSMIDYFLLIDT